MVFSANGFPMFLVSHIFSFIGASGVDQPPLSREVLGESRVAATIPGPRKSREGSADNYDMAMGQNPGT